MSEWLATCFEKAVVRRAAFSAFIVGGILVAINHGDAIMHGQIAGTRALRICLTVLVPYVVSTVTSVSTLRDIRNSPEAARRRQPK